MTSRTPFRTFLFAALLTVGLTVQAVAEEPALFNPDAKEPDIKGISLLETMTKDGAKLFFMGERSGLNGFLVMKNGQVQMLYVTPDRKSVLVGALFADNGQIVTPAQIAHLSEKNKEIAAVMSGTGEAQSEVVRAGAVQGGMASVPGNPSAAVSSPQAVIPAMPVSPGERLLLDMRAASTVMLGNDAAPELVMVVSPTCSHCKRTWEELRDSVKGGKLKVRMVPITRDTGDEELRAAAQLLRVKDPLQAWDAYVAGDKAALSGTPDELAKRAIIANRDMTDRWNILGTPYLVYRAKDGNIKIVQGKPERMAAVLAELVR